MNTTILPNPIQKEKFTTVQMTMLRVWRQFWVGADGVVLRLEGGLQDGAMVLTGELPAPAGGGNTAALKTGQCSVL